MTALHSEDLCRRRWRVATFYAQPHWGCQRIISGGAPVWAVKARDRFFGIPSGAARGSTWLPSIINNTVFRMECGHVPDLGTAVLSLWRKTIQTLWQDLYEIPVIGYETFIIKTPHRIGSMYLADNWTYVGITAGRTKIHTTARGLSNKSEWCDRDPKLIYCRWAKRPVLPVTEYQASWRRESTEDKQLDKVRTRRREAMIGCKFPA